MYIMEGTMKKRLHKGRMQSVVKKVTAVILVSVLSLTSYRPVLADTKQDLSNANDAKAAIEKKLQDVQNQLSQLNKDKKNIESYIKELDSNLASIDGDINSLGIQIEDKKNEITQAQEMLETVQQQSQEQYESMKLRIKYMYENGTDSSYLNMLITAQDMSDLLNKAEYINKITEYDRQMLDQYAATEQQIAETKELLEADLTSLEQMQVEVEGQKQALALIQSTKVNELQKLDNKSADAKAYQAQLEKDKKEQEAAILAMEAEIKRQEEEARRKAEEAKKNGTTPAVTVPTYDGGKFKWPTPSTRITSPYGDMEDRSSPHQGVDIGAKTRGVSGDPIYAAYDGTVTLATYSSSAGNWIWINHGNGLMTVYMHCSKLLVSEGTKVKKGDTIALMGTTGNSTGVHLHFGVRLNGKYVNPMSYFG